MWSGTCSAGVGRHFFRHFLFLVAYHLIYFFLTLPLIYPHHYVPFPTGITAARSSHQSQLNKIKRDCQGSKGEEWLLVVTGDCERGLRVGLPEAKGAHLGLPCSPMRYRVQD